MTAAIRRPHPRQATTHSPVARRAPGRGLRRAAWIAGLTGAALLGAAPAQAQLSEISEQELTCLALNIYHEARNQPIEGQLAVAHVTLNRTEARAPTSICDVVYRGWAFSWTRDPRKQRPPSDQQAWAIARAVARWALADRDGDPVFGSTFFHSVVVAPDWAPSKVRVRQIGDHVFYRDADTPREERASAAAGDGP